jgi:hypothetical protein
MPAIRLTRKLALTMNGVDVSHLKIGDVIDLPVEQAAMMIDHGWAEPVLPVPPPPSRLPRPRKTPRISQ